MPIRVSLDGELSAYSVSDELVACHQLQGRREGWHRVAEHHHALWRSVSAVEQRAGIDCLRASAAKNLEHLLNRLKMEP